MSYPHKNNKNSYESSGGNEFSTTNPSTSVIAKTKGSKKTIHNNTIDLGQKTQHFEGSAYMSKNPNYKMLKMNNYRLNTDKDLSSSNNKYNNNNKITHKITSILKIKDNKYHKMNIIKELWLRMKCQILLNIHYSV